MSAAAPGARDPEAHDALRRLEGRLDRASEAAEMLMAEAAAAAARAAANAADAPRTSAPPPSGWQTPAPDGTPPAPQIDLEALIRALAGLRELVPPDLQHRLAESVRELLMALRALIDWYLERVENRPAASTDVQDIPIL